MYDPKHSFKILKMRFFYSIIIFLLIFNILPDKIYSYQMKILSIDTSCTLIPVGNYFHDPVAFSVDPAGIIYVLDRGNNTIYKVLLEDTSLSFSTSYSWKDNADNQFRDIISPNGLDVYVADFGSNHIHRFDKNLNFVSSIPQYDFTSMEKIFGFPLSLDVDRFGALYFIDSENKNIRKISKSNQIEKTFGGYEAGLGRLKDPECLKISRDENLVYVSDIDRIVVFDIYGNYIKFIPSPGLSKHFTLAQGGIIIAESCSVSLIDEKGAIKKYTLQPTLIDKEGCIKIIDLEINQGVLYMLTKNYIILMGVKYQTIQRE